MGIRKQGWFVLASLAAMAPVAGAEAQRLSSGDVQRGVTVPTRSRSDYDPLGVRIGSFQLNGSAEAGVGWDSNLFGRQSNIVSDGYVGETANLNLRSDWTRHAVGVSGMIDSRQYFSQSGVDWTDWNLGTFGRYDFNASTNVEASYRHSREHLDVFNFDVQTAGIVRPVPFNTDEFVVSGNTRFNRLGLLATGTYRSYRFENLDGGGSSVSGNDFNTAIGALGASYSFTPGRSIVAVLRLQDINYTAAQPPDQNKDSFTWALLGGFEYDFEGVWQARVNLGWQERNYQGSRFKNLSGPAVEATVTYAPTRLTTFSLNVVQTIEESIRQDAVSYQRTGASLRVDHEYLRNVILGAELRIDRRAYEQPSQVATDGQLGLSARYLFNRSMSLVGTYAYSRRLESTGGINEYDRNIIQVRLRFAL